MYYSLMRQYDIANGEGIGCTIFFSGCKLKCKGCFQQETWSFTYGEELTKEKEQIFIDMCKNPHVDHISLLGGDFMQQEITDALHFIKRLKNEVGKPIWVWTGLLIETLNDSQRELLPYIDFLIDGRFIEDLKNLRLKFRGSSNQRIIDVQSTMKTGNIIERLDLY